MEEEEEENDDDDNDDAAEPSIDLQESESRNQSEELAIPDSQPGSPFREHSITGNSPVDFRSASSTPVPPSSSPVPKSSPQSSPNIQLHDDPAVGSLAGYDPSLRIDILANDGLIQIVDAWDGKGKGKGTLTLNYKEYFVLLENQMKKSIVDLFQEID